MSSIATLIDLNGAWESGGVVGPVISVSGNVFTVDMSALHRPAAHGTIIDSAHISVTFPDDKTYIGQLQMPGDIVWSNQSQWVKVIATVINLAGPWAYGGASGPVISVHGNAISVDMSFSQRPTAHGNILDATEIDITFPDDKSFSAQLTPPDKMIFSNDSLWTKIFAPAAPSALHVVSVLTDPVHSNGSVITVGWTSNSNNQTGFKVLEDGTGEIDTGPNVTTAAVQVANGSTYTFSVQAFNSAGTSASSSTIQVASLPVVARTITVSKSGTPAAMIAVVKGSNFTAGSLIVIRVVAMNLSSSKQFTANADATGKFTATCDFTCVSGVGLTFTAFEDANPTGTMSNAVVVACDS